LGTERLGIEKWMDLINGGITNVSSLETNTGRSFMGKYAATGTLTNYSKSGSTKKLVAVDFLDMWPQTVSEIALSYDTASDIEQFDVTWSYNHYKVKIQSTPGVTKHGSQSKENITMAFAVTEFKTNLASGGGGARPSLYSVDINGPTATIDTAFSTNSNILVKAATIPASTIAPLTVNYMGRAYKTPGFRTYDTWTVTVLNDENMEARQNIIQWMRMIAGNLDGARSSSTVNNTLVSTESSATVKQLGVDGSPKTSWTISQMWPTELGEIALDWSSDMIEEYYCKKLHLFYQTFICLNINGINLLITSELWHKNYLILDIRMQYIKIPKDIIQ
jgi:hypothetical protein